MEGRAWMDRKLKMLIYILFISILGVVKIDIIGAQEDYRSVKLYYLNEVSKYETFLNNPENDSIFCEDDVWTMNIDTPKPPMQFYYYSPEDADVLENNALIFAYIAPIYPDLEIYNKKVVRPAYYYSKYFNAGDLLWLSTNHGIKIIEFKKIWAYMPSRLNADSQEGDLWVNASEPLKSDSKGISYYDLRQALDIIYYDLPEKYTQKYKNKKTEIFVNGKRNEDICHIEYRNGSILLPFEFVFEQCGIYVQKLSEDKGKWTTMEVSDSESSLYFVFEADGSKFNDVEGLVLTEEEYAIFCEEGSFGKKEWLITPITENLKSVIRLPYVHGNIMIATEMVNSILAIFGKGISTCIENDKVYIDVYDVDRVPIFNPESSY